MTIIHRKPDLLRDIRDILRRLRNLERLLRTAPSAPRQASGWNGDFFTANDGDPWTGPDDSSVVQITWPASRIVTFTISAWPVDVSGSVTGRIGVAVLLASDSSVLWDSNGSGYAQAPVNTPGHTSWTFTIAPALGGTPTAGTVVKVKPLYSASGGNANYAQRALSVLPSP